MKKIIIFIITSFILIIPNVYAEDNKQSIYNNSNNDNTNLAENAKRAIPTWLEVNRDTKSGKVVAVPEREQIDLPVEEHLIVELYSK